MDGDDEPDLVLPAKGVLQIPSMMVINSSAQEEQTGAKGQRPASHQQRRGVKAAKAAERRANKKTYRKDGGDTPSSRGGKGKDPHRTKEGILTSLLPDDCRISTLLRRLHHESDLEVFFSVTSMLHEALLSAENGRYVRRALETITESLLENLQTGPSSDARSEAARCLGAAGAALDGDLKRFFDWTFLTFHREKRDDVRILLVEALQHMLLLEKEYSRQEESNEILLTHLHEALETTANPDVMWAVLDTILLVAKAYPKSLIKFFTDIVDILIGWHVDISQPESVIKVASYGLRELHQYWLLDFPFTVGLLSQFLEDMEAYREDLAQDLDSNAEAEISPEDYTQRIKLTIEVFNTVVQCLGPAALPKESSPITAAFWSDSLKRILEAVISTVEHSESPESVVMSANQSVLILVDVLGPQGWSNCLHVFISLQLMGVLDYPKSAVISFCKMVSKVVRVCGVNLPAELIGELIGAQSPLLMLRTGCEKRKTALIEVYHSLLSLKNIPLLQETYSLVLQDLSEAYRVLVPSVKSFVSVQGTAKFGEYGPKESERVVLFLLNALIDIARASSIIGMWALKPTIMELLSEHLLPDEQHLLLLPPAIQFTLLTIMNSHCTKYSNFLSSSSLVKSVSPHFSQESVSPSTGYFSMILKILTTALSNETALCHEAVLLSLQWSKELFAHARSCLDRLLRSPLFLQLVRAVVSQGHSSAPEIAVAVAGCLSTLLQGITVNPAMMEILSSVVQLCVLHLNSLDPLVKACYHELFQLCPWTLSLNYFVQIQSNQGDATKRVEDVAKIHQIRESIGEINSFQFSQLMSYLLQGSQPSSQWVSDTLNLSLVVPIADAKNGVPGQLRATCNHSSKALWHWATWQAAAFAVNAKLRTPLGKPQETFAAIEGAVKSLARQFDTDRVQEGDRSAPQNAIHDMRQARLLLDFLNQLEKCIYNASEGTAIAMPTPAKPVRLFFYTNKTVCAEWISRIRWAVVMVAVHSGLPHVALQHGFELLADLVAHPHGTAEIEKATILLSNALLQLQEPEALNGLYRWCRDKTGHSFPWLKVAALQATDRYEEAIKEYLLELNCKENLSAHHLSVTSDQLCECLMGEADWGRLATVKADLDKHCGRYDTLVSSCLSLDLVKRLSSFEQLGKCEGDPSSATQFDFDLHKPNRVLAQITEEISNVALRLHSGNQDHTLSMVSELDECRRALQELLEEAVRGESKNISQDVVILRQVSHGLKEFLKNPTSKFRNPLGLSSEDLSSRLLGKILYWNKLLQPLCQSDMASSYLVAGRLARKSGNVNRAKQLLTDYWKLRCADVMSFDELRPDAGVDFQAEKETAKLFYCMNKETEAISILARSVKKFATLAATGNKEEHRPAASALALSLAKKVAQYSSKDKAVNLHSLNDLAELLQWAHQRPDSLTQHGIYIPDAVGDTISKELFRISLEACPRNAKAWGQLAAWSYKQGRRASGWDEEGGASSAPLERDQRQLAAILGPECGSDTIFSVMSVLHEHGKNVPNDKKLTESLSAVLAGKVNEPDQRVSLVVTFWQQSNMGHLLLQSAVVAYFNFLRLYDSDDQMAESALTATLRLLRIIVKNASSFREVLEEGLDSTPTAPWKGIIPQLFSRLNHPEAFVRRRLSELLCRLAIDAPHLILFPAVVGCTSTGKGVLKNDNLMESFVQDEEDYYEEEEEEDEAEEDLDEVGGGAELRSCFLAMVETLSGQAPASISQVRLLVSELRRVTVLWDELWMGCLSQHQHDVARRLYQLEAERTKLQENTDLDEPTRQVLMRRKYQIVMKPVLLVLELLAQLTTAPPETPHEQNFQTAHLENIQKALEALREPPADQELQPQLCWQRLKLLHAELLRQSQKRSCTSLRLRDISPQLAALTDSAITMPGLSQPQVTIAGIEDAVSILPTKTRPKKLAMRGSDGKVYVYLFKGLEDLHLDERIMQFLSISNVMLQGVGKGLQARHYSVVPLGARSGLISWVEGVQPVFSLYKRWQLRSAAAKQLRQQQQMAPTVPRPSELFYSKLQPLLVELNVAVENRKEWPLAALRQVLHALQAETPADLLAKELWCTSTSAPHWWSVTKNYSRSLAVMSVIGYIIGLGDRHLDNLLVNLATGEIVHIDYNVCFEKGHTLRVPEKVPFRMTQNLQTALGVTGVEGIFRSTCEQVLRVMKQGREPLLTLLEAFVYDPLIDWTPDMEAGYTGAVFDGLSQRAVEGVPRPSRKALEREAALGMLAVRATEMRAAWFRNKEELESSRAQLAEKLQTWVGSWAEVHRVQSGVHDAHQQMAVLKEAAAVGPAHALFSLRERHLNFVRLQTALGDAETQLRKIMDDANVSAHLIQSAVVAVSGGELRLWSSELQEMDLHCKQDIFDLVREFLTSAGQASILEQCERLEHQFSEEVRQMQSALAGCLDLLSQFGMMASLMAPKQLQCRHSALHAKLAEEVLATLSAERCRAAAIQLQQHAAMAARPPSEHLVNFQAQLQVAAKHSAARLHEALKKPSEDPKSQLVTISQQLQEQARPESGKVLGVTIVQKLISVNANILALEAAAANTGESLVDLTLREGEWFLDKMMHMSGLTLELAQLLTAINPHSEPLAAAVGCLDATFNVFNDLEELIVNTSRIIAPDAASGLIIEEPSVLAVFLGLGELLGSLSKPLPEVAEELEVNLKYLALELPVPHPNAQESCARLKEGVARLLHHDGNEPLSAGQKLLMGFSGLFERLQNDTAKLMIAMRSVAIPPAWLRFDQFRRARALSWTVRKECSQSLVDDMFVIKMVQAAHELFSLAQRSAQAFHGRPEGAPLLVGEEPLVQPVRRFCADLIRLQLLGLQPEAVAVVVCTAMEVLQGVDLTELVGRREVGAEGSIALADTCLAVSSGADAQRMLTLLDEFEASWRSKEACRLARRHQHAAQAVLQHHQLRATVHAWIHDFPHSGRPMFVLNLSKTSRLVEALLPGLLEVIDQHRTLAENIVQRLKWAAGANPTLAEVLVTFTNMSRERLEKLSGLQTLAARVAAACAGLLRLEVMRNNSAEAAGAHSRLLQLLTQCEQGLAAAEAAGPASLSPAERGLARLLPVGGASLDASWLQSAEQALAAHIVAGSNRLAAEKTRQVAAFASVKSAAAELRAVLTAHHGLMGGVRPLLRTLAKPGEGRESLLKYVAQYKNFSEEFSAVVQCLAMEELELNQGKALLHQLGALHAMIDPIYIDLLDIPALCQDEEKKHYTPAHQQSTPDDDAQGGDRKQKVSVERNAFALGVLRRVRAKLEGRDAEPGRAMSVSEQVERAISESVSEDNLCQHYEGWTPWV